MKKWTDKEIDILKKNAENGMGECLKYIDRTQSSIQSKAQKLGINIKYVMSDDGKMKLSIAMKKSILEGRSRGWYYINTDKSRKSYPEKFFCNVFMENKMYEKYTIIEKYPYGKYFIDFLFVEIKLIVEVDGSQHYRTQEAILHDSIRDEYFKNEGFKIYRIKWSDVIKNPQSEILELNSFILDIDKNSYRKYNISDCSKKKDSFCKCGNMKHQKSQKCRPCEIMNQRKVKVRPSVEELMRETSEIGFLATGRKYGVSDNAIRKWIKGGLTER